MKLVKRFWLVAGYSYSAIFLLSCFTWLIAPLQFAYISFLALAFPFLFAGQLLGAAFTFLVNRKHALVFFLLLFAGYKNLRASFAFETNERFTPAKTAGTLRVLTWNVLYFRGKSAGDPSEHLHKMLEVVERYNADVFCVQDYQRSAFTPGVPDVKLELSKRGYRYLVQSDPEQPGETPAGYAGVAIFSKWPVLGQGRLPIATMPDEYLLHADLRVGSDTVRVFNVHLKSFQLYRDTSGTHSRLGNYRIGYERKRFFIRQIRDVEKAHATQVKRIRTVMDTTRHPLVFCGDINATPASYTYHTLQKGLRDAFTASGFGFGSTYSNVVPTLRIDVILASRQFRVTQVAVDKSGLSDHKAVVADLEWTNRNE